MVFTDFSGQHIVPIFKGQAVKAECLTLEDRVGMWCRNFDKNPTNEMQHPIEKKTSITQRPKP
jgi:hypothetical protein